MFCIVLDFRLPEFPVKRNRSGMYLCQFAELNHQEEVTTFKTPTGDEMWS